ncbi:hypothetical protein ABEX29_27035 [Brevibacillus porteri]|uniref:hypothetical protein n=1 Tax=Brevibacillus porteri TaxID=2126350 RepID=UPI003D1EB5F1
MTKSKKMSMVALVLCGLFGGVGAAYAAVSYPYSNLQYGDSVWLYGDLSYSGAGHNDGRPSIVHRHDVKFKNTITGVEDKDYIKTLQLDIEKLLPTDDFIDRNGYHLVPVEEELIKDLARRANGNADYVWEQVSSMKTTKYVRYYKINRQVWIPLVSVVYLSGGGEPDMQKVQ